MFEGNHRSESVTRNRCMASIPRFASGGARRLAVLGMTLAFAAPASAQHSAAREWNEELLGAIRRDFARPTVHARNLFHTSVAMWDAWAAYDAVADTYLNHERLTAADIEAARSEAISFAMYRILRHRFASSPGVALSYASFDAKMAEHGYNTAFTSTVGNTPAALGNRVAAAVIAYGLADGSNEGLGYANQHYAPINPPLVVALPGNPDIVAPNRWQPLALSFFIDQAGNIILGGYPPALSPEWGQVKPFALTTDDLTIHHRDGFDYWVYHDPGPPPYWGTATEAEYKSTFELVIQWSGYLDPTDGVMIDISPAARGNNTLGTNDGSGYPLNPSTGLPYDPQVVPAGDYYRVLSEFWADGPSSETPPGHWFTIANYVADHPMVIKKLGGVGPTLGDLEWDVKIYLALAGTVHDVAIACWGAKGWYDYVRPISAIRFLADLGQCTDPLGPSYHPGGINLHPGWIEVVTAGSTAPGERHEHLAGDAGANIGKIAVKAWRGPNYVPDPATTTAGVGWILAENWWPYQRPTFVTPPFPGYFSGHSTYSRGAATLMTLFTGDEFFPGGLGEFPAPQNEFLVFEDGPSVDVTLEWARYYDASDECSLSRIYGGIHPPADDIPGRFTGAAIAPESFAKALSYFDGSANCYEDLDGDGHGSTVVIPSEDGDCGGAGESSSYDDCNDGNGSIYAGATEIVGDAIDQDCNGFDTVSCFVDADEDGFGSTTTLLAADGDCTDPGEATNGTDCNDSDAASYPGATETINDGIDQNCNGFDTVSCFTDGDGDGVGTLFPLLADDGDCTDPGEATSANDCDDSDPANYPGNAEACDGQDNNCNGLSDETPQCGPPPGPVVPTVTQWGLFLMLLLGMTLGTLVFARARIGEARRKM